jgi:hypothetical protein
MVHPKKMRNQRHWGKHEWKPWPRRAYTAGVPEHLQCGADEDLKRLRIDSNASIWHHSHTRTSELALDCRIQIGFPPLVFHTKVSAAAMLRIFRVVVLPRSSFFFLTFYQDHRSQRNQSIQSPISLLAFSQVRSLVTGWAIGHVIWPKPMLRLFVRPNQPGRRRKSTI